MIIIHLIFSMAIAFILVCLLENCWVNRPLEVRRHWAKPRAMSFAWAIIGLVLTIGQIPVGLITCIFALPVCLSHLRLIERNPVKRVRSADVINDLYLVVKTRMLRVFGPGNK